MKQSKPFGKSRYCFVSYSSREQHVKLLIEAIECVFKPAFEIEYTPSALESGTSQLNRIEELIKNCSFAIVVLDGLRPNVVFEYGILKGQNKPIILLKEPSATVDLLGYFGDRAGLNLPSAPLDPDKHLSDVKDQTYIGWDRNSFRATIKTLWQEYQKKRDKIHREAVDLKEPKV
jgi:hypothetical protein